MLAETNVAAKLRRGMALHMSVAEEIATACGGGMYGVDLRPRPQGVRCA